MADQGGDKYGGLIKLSPIKVLRNQFIALFTYLDSVVPNNYPMHTIISVWRIIQFIGPCLCAANSTIWNPDSIAGKGISIISILFHIVPVEYRKKASIILELVYSILMIIFFVIISISAYIYRKSAKLPFLLPTILSIFIHTLGYILHPIALNSIGETIGRLIDGQDLQFDTAIEVVSIILVVLCYAIWYIFYDQICIISLLFRPNSLTTVLPNPQMIFFITTSLVTFLSAIASQLSKYPSAVLTFIVAILYLGGIWSVFVPGTFITQTHQQLVLMASATSCLMSLIMGIYVIAGRESSFAEIFIFIVVLVAAYVAAMFFNKARTRKQILKLDQLNDESITIDDFKSPDETLFHAITGMACAHPVCADWSIFKEATQKWPENLNLWVTYAKFVAIYPSQNNLLSYVTFSMNSLKLKGNLAKQIIAQASTVSTQRESTLSPILKNKLSRSTKLVQGTKRKLRRVWDLVIQGTINDMESCINTAYQSVTKARSNFNHILSQYPNNRFVARNYVRFLLEIEVDPEKYTEWVEKTKLLQRGVLVNVDRTHVLGMHAFPGLPQSVGQNQSLQSNVSDIDSSVSDMSDVGMSADDAATSQVSTEQMSVIRDRIDELSISATGCIRFWNILLMVGLIALPTIIILVYLNSYINGLTDSLEFMYHLSYLRSLSVQIPIFAHHHLLELTEFFDKPTFESPPDAYGGATDTSSQLRYLIQAMTASLESLSQFQNWKIDNEYIQPAHKIVYENIIPYRYYTYQANYTNPNYTLQTTISDIVMFSASLLDRIALLSKDDPNVCNATAPEKCWNLTNTTSILNPYLNYPVVSQEISDALGYLTIFLNVNAEDVENISMFVLLLVCIIYVVVVFGLLLYQLDSLEKCKKAIYKCLTALPKNVVSSVSESLRILKKDNDQMDQNDTDSEMNKQEENIMKIFASTGDASSMKSSEKTILIVLTVIMLVCALVAYILILLTFPDVVNTLRDTAPHLDYILGSIAYLFSCFGAVENLAATYNDHGIALNYSVLSTNGDPANIKEWKAYLINQSYVNMQTFARYYQSARYGAETSNEPPFSTFDDSIKETDEDINCEVTNLTAKTVNYNCFKSELQVNLFQPLVTIFLVPLSEDLEAASPTLTIDSHDILFKNLWNMITYNLYNKLFFPIFGTIVPEMTDTLFGLFPPTRTAVIIILIVAFCDLVGIVLLAGVSQNKMKFALRLLLHCPPGAVLQTPKIMKILSGDFTSKTKDTGVKTSDFFDSIVESIPESIIITDQEFKVVSANKATDRIFGQKPDDLIGTDIREFFKDQSKFGESALNAFDEFNTTTNAEFIKDSDSAKTFVAIRLTQANQNYVIECGDQTQTVLYNNLIAEEKVKSDRLLSSILPANLVPRVQAGEKNISFSVQSATILFLDVVEFTPWCASNTAATVMSTLNELFRKFDAYLATHSTMTKIKCIGDCYMCAGGIFVELNQPAVHAKEVVEFGLESIQSVEQNNKEMDQSLRIRVGINTGGPIVAGVLGTEKPTFEILGPAINMAQQMEHHGVPMKVHVSRPVYELIYGGSFIVKERGQIEIKNGTAMTYLIEGKR